MEIIIRATVIYFFLWAVARATGKRELAQLTVFELLMLITMGDLVQQGVVQEDMSLVGAMLAIATIAFWIMVFSYLSWRFKKIQPVVEGVPLVIVRDEQPLEEVLRLDRVTLDELKEGVRNHGINNLGEIKLGVLEPDGEFSFITKSGEPQGDSKKDKKL